MSVVEDRAGKDLYHEKGFVLKSDWKGVTMNKLLIAVLLFMGCQTATNNSAGHQSKNRPKIEVNLPPKPNLDIKHPPEMYVDGSYSVEGLLKNFGKLRGKEVKLTGYVKALNLCPEGEDVQCTLEPNAILGDFPTGPSQKIFVFAADEGGLAILKGLALGQKVTLKGTVKLSSPKATVIEPKGLVVLKSETSKDKNSQTK